MTNDDGVESPGLAAAATALDPLGELIIAAPRTQQTSRSRSRSHRETDRKFSRHVVSHGGSEWDAFAVDASPAVTVDLALHSLVDRIPELVVSGINYGENVGTSVSVSGTIGAALEAAEHGIRSLAVSLEIHSEDYHSYDQGLNFSAAIHFIKLFAGRMLELNLPFDVDVLKLEVPAGATPDTDWCVTRQDRIPYYAVDVREPGDEEQGAVMGHRPRKGEYTGVGTDAYALAQGMVSITPLSLDMTSRVELDKLEKILTRKR